MKSLYSYITESDLNKFTLVAVGDALCHKSLYDTCNHNDFKDILSNYKLDKSNLNFYNQESIIGNKFISFYKRETMSEQVHFCAPENFAKSFLDAGFNMVSLANNHVLDMDDKGVENSMKFWKKQNVIYAGQYMNEDERFKTRIYHKNGISFAFFAYTDKINTKYNSTEHPYYRNVFDYDLAKRDIESVRDKVDVVIVSIHWGTEHTFTPNQDQRNIAKFFASIGVDIVLGGHSHCVQCVDMIDNTFVAYSLGNFVADQNTSNLSTEIGLQLTIDIEKKNGKIFKTPHGRLTYFHRGPGKDKYKLFYLDKVNDELLPNHETILKEYWKSVTRYYNIEYK